MVNETLASLAILGARLPAHYRIPSLVDLDREQVFTYDGDFEVEHRMKAGRHTFEISGSFDLLHAGLVKDLLTERIALYHQTGVDVTGVDCDLSGITALDSVAVGVLVVARCLMPDRPFRLIGVPAVYDRLFKNMGLFEMVDGPRA